MSVIQEAALDFNFIGDSCGSVRGFEMRFVTTSHLGTLRGMRWRIMRFEEREAFSGTCTGAGPEPGPLHYAVAWNLSHVSQTWLFRAYQRNID